MKQLFFLFFFLISFSNAQTYNWWIFFNDKDCNSVIQLSDKSIERRMQQKIPFDIHDFPICQKYIDSLQINDVNIRHYSYLNRTCSPDQRSGGVRQLKEWLGKCLTQDNINLKLYNRFT